MIASFLINLFSLFLYDRLSTKPKLFKSFPELTVQEFNGIYDNKIVKKYEKCEIKRLSYKLYENREQKYDAMGRPFFRWMSNMGD